jgi:hypothetical protein
LCVEITLLRVENTLVRVVITDLFCSYAGDLKSVEFCCDKKHEMADEKENHI